MECGDQLPDLHRIEVRIRVVEVDPTVEPDPHATAVATGPPDSRPHDPRSKRIEDAGNVLVGERDRQDACSYAGLTTASACRIGAEGRKPLKVQ